MARRTWDIEEVTFTVDRDKLDEEWVNQPDLFHEFARQSADARLALEEKKQELDVVRAEIDKDIRERPGRYDADKVTENAIANIIILQPKFAKAQSAVNKARHTLDILQAAVSALEHRKKALEHLVFLHGQEYFSSPRARGVDSEKMRDAEKKSARRTKGMSREDLEEDE